MSAAPHACDGIPARILEEAAAWFASLADVSVSDVDRRRWQAWLVADPDHARAWKQVEAVTGRFAPLADAGDAVRSALEVPRRRGRRNSLRTLGVLLLVGGSGLLASRITWREWRRDVAMRRADYRTVLGQVVTLPLTDGGGIWLGSLSALDLDYGSRLRRLSLYQGDVLVETATDDRIPARPFVVDTPHGRLRALGTRFAVRSDADKSRVDVFLGSVELWPADAGRVVHVVRTGDHAVFDGGTFVVGRADPAREAWSRGILLADRMRLDDMIAELARWHALPIVCDPDVAGLRLVGAFPLSDLQRILAALDDSLPVGAVREDHRVRIVAAVVTPLPLSPHVSTPRPLRPLE